MAQTDFKLNNPVVITLVSLVVLLFLALVLVIGRNINKPFIIPPSTPAPIASNLFSNCAELAKDCNDNKCYYYNLCAFASDFKSCRVYDCGKSYGIEISAKNGNILTKSYEKPKIEDIKAASAACQGTVKIVGDKCEKNATRKITAKVATSGECAVEAFVYRQGNDLKPAVFASSANDAYLLTIPSCDPIAEVSAIGSSGRLIGSASVDK